MTSAPNLLLVNGDDKKRAQLARYIVENSKYQVIEAPTGTIAASLLKSHDIRCVVSDIYVDGIDGWRLARMVRSGVFSCHELIPFIIVSTTLCERIAETTAREFDIDHLIPFEKFHLLRELLDEELGAQSSYRHASLLAIEDAEDTSTLIQRILRGRFEVDVAPDGPSGLELWREKQHPIILLDVMLPGMSGPEVMERILEEKPDQTIVIMTAHGTMDLAEELMMKGASDFISKPFRNAQLRKVCEIASRREDFMISNDQFAETIESLRQNQGAMVAQSREHKHILNNLTTAVLELNSNGQITFCNSAWQSLSGLREKETLGHKLSVYACDDAHNYQSQVESSIADIVQGHSFRSRMEFKLGAQFSQGAWVEARFNRINRDQRVVISVSLDDISARKLAEQQLEHMALHDSLTGLHNRHFFDAELTRIAQEAQDDKRHHALLYIDLDHFKAINDTQGHNQGDYVLKDVACKLRDRLRETDRICRIGGDEFTVILRETSIEQANQIAHDLCAIITSGQYSFNNQTLRVSCSIGISEIDGSKERGLEYLQQADLALYVAKRSGRNYVHLFTEEDRESGDVKSSMQWLHAVQHAITQNNLVLHFQPIYHIESGQVAYYEALVRLQIDDRIVYPGDFIPALERFEDTALLDKHVVSHAIGLLAIHPQLKRVAINLSAQAFSNERLVPLIREKCSEFGVDPQRIIFELTESASLSNLSATQHMVAQLSEMGCAFSIDDFGTGFSTFSYLKNLPAQTVKIDGSFVRELTNSSVDRALVKAIREVAHALGKETVAEFVEDQETLDLLREINVDYAQGYHLGRPQPISELFEDTPLLANTGSL